MTYRVIADPTAVRTSTVFVALLRRDVHVAMKKLRSFLFLGFRKRAIG